MGEREAVRPLPAGIARSQIGQPEGRPLETKGPQGRALVAEIEDRGGPRIPRYWFQREENR